MTRANRATPNPLCRMATGSLRMSQNASRPHCGAEALVIIAAAHEMGERSDGDTVTYVRNQNLHVSKICKNLCGFCGFGRKATDEGRTAPITSTTFRWHGGRGAQDDPACPALRCQ